MTFFGYSEEDIITQKQELEKRVRECEECPERCVPLSEVFGEDFDIGDVEQGETKHWTYYKMKKKGSLSFNVLYGKLKLPMVNTYP